MADRNGYFPSIFPLNEDGTCLICKRVGDTARHEIFHGPNRQISKRLGAWISVCPACHSKIHAGDNTEYLWLKESAQRLLEIKIGHREYMRRIGRNYLDQEEWVEIAPEGSKRGL